MKIGIIGAGSIGGASAGLLAGGGDVLITDRNLDRANAVVAEIGSGVTASSVNETLAADIVVLALWYPGAVEFVREHAAQLAGKTIVDINDPLNEAWIRLFKGRAAQRQSPAEVDAAAVERVPATERA